MRKQILFLSAIFIFMLAGCQKEDTNTVQPVQEATKVLKSGVEEPCYEESYVLYGGQTIEVGTLTVSNDEDEIFVTYDLSHTDWYLDETHLYVGAAEDIPLTGSGNPKIGHFPYSESHNSSSDQVYTYTFDRDDFGECFAVAAHAVVVQRDANGSKLDEQTAFADGGTEFPGKRWGWYLREYCVEDCVPDFVCNGAFGRNVATSNCFTNFGFSDYGWTNGPYPGNFAEGYCSYTELYSCPTSCDPNGLVQLGAVRIKDVEGDLLGVRISDIISGYTLKEAYIYVGTSPLPMINGSYSINPDDYTFSNFNVENNFWEVSFPNFEQGFYVIAYAVVEEN